MKLQVRCNDCNEIYTLGDGEMPIHNILVEVFDTFVNRHKNCRGKLQFGYDMGGPNDNPYLNTNPIMSPPPGCQHKLERIGTADDSTGPFGEENLICKFCGITAKELYLKGNEPTFSCPRRMNEGGPWESKEGVLYDYWRDDGSCSFCGGLSEEKVKELLKEGWHITKTRKNYKLYIEHQNHMKKIYLMHFSQEQIDSLNQTVTSIREGDEEDPKEKE